MIDIIYTALKFKENTNEILNEIKNSINLSKNDVEILDMNICNDVKLINKMDFVLIKLRKLTDNYDKKSNYSKY